MRHLQKITENQIASGSESEEDEDENRHEEEADENETSQNPNIYNHVTVVRKILKGKRKHNRTTLEVKSK